MTDPMPLLMAKYDFTADDLATNRQGKVTQRQLDRYVSAKREFFRIVMFLVTVVFCPCSCLISLTPPTARDPGPRWVYMLVFAGIYGVWVVGSWIIQQREERLVLKTPTLFQYVGEAGIVQRWGRHQIQYYLQVGAVELERSELGPKELESMRACIEGKSVRLRAYILKYSNHVVSMEVV